MALFNVILKLGCFPFLIGIVKILKLKNKGLNNNFSQIFFHKNFYLFRQIGITGTCLLSVCYP